MDNLNDGSFATRHDNSATRWGTEYRGKFVREKFREFGRLIDNGGRAVVTLCVSMVQIFRFGIIRSRMVLFILVLDCCAI